MWKGDHFPCGQEHAVKKLRLSSMDIVSLERNIEEAARWEDSSRAKKTKKGPSKEKTEGEFPCPQCKKKYKTYNHLNTHKMREHEEKKYMCEECDFQSSWLSHFLSHKQNKHEGK